MLRYLTAGESHGKGLMAILDGIPAGLPLSAENIDRDLLRRQQGYGRGKRMSIEKDRVKIFSGVRGGETLGSPIALWIRNRDWKNWKETMDLRPNPGSKASDFITAPRPGHADLPGVIKYARDDVRDVLERASARETAIRVAVGAVCRRLLQEFQTEIYSRVIQIGSIKDASDPGEMMARYEWVEKSSLRCLDEQTEKKMVALIDEAKEQGDTLGGVFEIMVTGLPPGLGSYVQWDLKLDANLARALMSIQAVSGVEIGSGFGLAGRRGSQVQDEIFYDHSHRSYYRKTNRSGGIEGGMTNGEPLIVRAAMKPLSTLGKPLSSVDLRTKAQVRACRERSDVCAVPAASIIAEAAVAFEIAKVMQDKFGGDSLPEMRRNYLSYREYLTRR